MPDYGRWTSGGGDPSLNEINRADRFFEALAAKQPVYSTDPAEAELAFLFAEFRDDVRDAPVTTPVSAGDAAEALRDGLVTNRGPRRGFAIVGSVAAAMLCIGGFGTAVYGAGPGDSLYGMRTAIFGQQEQTRDDQVSLASAQLQQVQQLIDQGQWQQAQDKLVEVSSAVQGVDQTSSKQQLVEQWNALTYKVVEQNPEATLPPGQPLPVLPSSPLTWLPVPVADSPTSTSTTTSESTSDSASSSSSETSSSSQTSSSSSSSETSTSPESSPSPDSPAPSSSISTPAPASTPSPSTASPSSSTTTTSSTATTTTSTTSITTMPSPKPVDVAPSSSAVAPVPSSSAPVVAPSASQPRLAPNPSVESSQPVTSTPASAKPSVTPTTTTTVVPPAGGVA